MSVSRPATGIEAGPGAPLGDEGCAEVDGCGQRSDPQTLVRPRPKARRWRNAKGVERRNLAPWGETLGQARRSRSSSQTPSARTARPPCLDLTAAGRRLRLLHVFGISPFSGSCLRNTILKLRIVRKTICILCLCNASMTHSLPEQATL